MNRFLARFTLAQKLFASSVVFLLPVAILLWFAISGYSAYTEQAKTGLVVCVLLSVVAVFVAGSLLWVVARNLSRPLGRIAETTGQISAGKLDEAEQSLSDAEIERLMGTATKPVAARDEMWRLVEGNRTMIRDLKALLQQVRMSGMQVNGSTTQMAAAVAQIEATVSEQAASTNEIAATSKEILATVTDLARTMETVTGMASEAAQLADSGVTQIEGINRTVDYLVRGAGDVTGTLTAIRESSVRISKVIEAITRVANRTNMISLNAAIEAEKAGAHAAGFSIVAIEVRRLADQTAVAALDIEGLILEMQKTVENGVTGIEEFAERARAGSKDIAGITENLGRLMDCTRKLGPHFEIVNGGMQMQLQSAGQITTAMQKLSEAAVQTRGALKGLRESAHGLRGAVGGLQTGVARFAAEK